AVCARLLDVRALAREFGDVVAGGERLRAGAAQDDAADVLARGKRDEDLAQPLPHRPGQRVELLRAIQDDGNHVTALLDEDRFVRAHALPRAQRRLRSGQKRSTSASVVIVPTRLFDQKTRMSPPAPIIESRNASSARLPSTSARVRGASGMP